MGISRQILQAMFVCVVIQLSYQQTDSTTDDGYFYYQNAEYPKDCMEIKLQCTDATPESKVHVIKPEGFEEPFEVYCDQETDNGGWTVFQRRRSDTIDFGRNMTYYKNGFGFLNEEHWLGNDKLAYLTNQKKYQLRIDLAEDGSSYATYNDFRITDEEGVYRMVSLGTYDGSGGAANGLNGQEGKDFTFDYSGCSGGWWYSTANCNSQANLNGGYTGNANAKFHWTSGDALTFSEMKIRPVA